MACYAEIRPKYQAKSAGIAPAGLFSYHQERLEQEDIIVTARSLQRLDKKFHDEGTFKDLPRNKHIKKLSQPMIKFINDKLEEDDKLTSTKLRALLMQNWPGLNVSLTTVKRYRRKQGWVCTHPHYCQLI